MKFKGNIVLTDPLYIIKDDNPNDWELCEKGNNMEALGITNYITEQTFIGDAFVDVTSVKNLDPNVVVSELYQIESVLGMFSNDEKNKEAECKYAELIKNLNCIGSFSVDSGYFGVFLLEEIKKYNPEFEALISKCKYCAEVIRDFDGEINFRVFDNSLVNMNHIVGDGNIKFFTN